MNPLDPKKAALARLLAQANTGLFADLKDRYAPKPPPSPVAEPAPAPADPLAGLGPDELEMLLAAKPRETVRVDLNGKPTTYKGVDRSMKDKYGNTVPADENGNQYTELGLRQMRAGDPEWPQREREMKQDIRNEETGTERPKAKNSVWEEEE